MQEKTHTTATDGKQEVTTYLSWVGEQVRAHIEAHALTRQLAPHYFKDGVMLYPRRAGKALRPGLLLAASRILGANDEGALAVGAAVEMFHIFTLVHDDIIDRDEIRRGGPSSHAFFQHYLKGNYRLPQEQTMHLGEALAILAGDVEHAFAVSLITTAARQGLLSPEVALFLLDELEVGVLTPLVEGQVLDLMLSIMPLDEVTESAIVDMLWKKTGVLFQYSLMAGAIIGLNRVEPDHADVKLFTEIGRSFGIAFQFMDDLLGLIGEQKTFGKPIGSDLMEGKRTPIVVHAFQNAGSHDRTLLRDLLGRPDLSPEQIAKLIRIITEAGGFDHARRRIAELLGRCQELMAQLPPHAATSLLAGIAAYAAGRNK